MLIKVPREDQENTRPARCADLERSAYNCEAPEIDVLKGGTHTRTHACKNACTNEHARTQAPLRAPARAIPREVAWA